MSRSLIFDTETTGLLQPKISPLEKQPSIISFYGVVIDEEGKLLETIDYHFNPGFDVSPTITKITGITNEFLKDKPTFKEHEEQIRNIIMSCDFAIAHNAKFDTEMVDNEMRRCDSFDKLIWPKVICTVEQTMSFKGHRLNLTALHTHLFGVPFSNAHSAGGDVAALLACVLKLREMGVI
jgi:DNA polymerase-3 subunit alpha